MPVLTFKGKTAVENHHHTVPHHVLELDADRSVLAKGEKPSLDGNLIIEGDNLLALKALLPTHAGRIKCIYIDPPYNTGNEGWVYNDNLTQPQFKEWIGQVVGKEGEDATRHDKWCCMMYPRLQLLRELLREDGAIFISIDDNEIAHLRSISDDIFGAENYVATFIWEKRTTRENRRVFSFNHDYLVCYALVKSQFESSRNLLPLTEEVEARYANPDADKRGPWQSVSLNAQAGHGTPAQFYDIVLPSGRTLPPPTGRCWTVTKPKLEQLVADGRVWFGKDGDGVPRLKLFRSEVEAGLTPHTLWRAAEVGTNDSAKKELIELFDGKDAFETPKPVGLIRRVLSICTDDGDIVLDPTAGSGTTAHAVIDLSHNGDGVRRFVLIQQRAESLDSKSNICDEVTAERVRRLIRGHTRPKRNGDAKQSEKVEGLGGSFSYARLGPPLLGEHKTWGEKPPAFGDLAQYIYFTETSRQLDAKEVNESTGRLGEHAGTSYYLLYTPDPKQSRPLDRNAMEAIAKDKARRKVVYCEKLWLHRDELAAAREQGNDVRPMLLPFQVK